MEIELCGYKVLIDDEDYEKLTSYTWYINRNAERLKNKIYYECKIKDITGRHTIRLHRVIMNLKTGDGFVVDHINGNTLDNRKANLRICTNKENVRNQKKSIKNTSGYKGVTFNKRDRKYQAYIRVDGRRKGLGYYYTAKEAHAAYCEASKKYHGEFGRTE